MAPDPSKQDAQADPEENVTLQSMQSTLLGAFNSKCSELETRIGSVALTTNAVVETMNAVSSSVNALSWNAQQQQTSLGALQSSIEETNSRTATDVAALREAMQAMTARIDTLEAQPVPPATPVDSAPSAHAAPPRARPVGKGRGKGTSGQDASQMANPCRLLIMGFGREMKSSALREHWEAISHLLPGKERADATPRCYAGKRNYMLDFSKPEIALAAYDIFSSRVDTPVMTWKFEDGEVVPLTVKRDSPPWINLLKRHFARIHPDVVKELKSKNQLRHGLTVSGPRVLINWDMQTVRTLFVLSVDASGAPRLAPDKETAALIQLSPDLIAKWKEVYESH